MGLFSSKKNLCPICGEPTPKLFPTKIEDTPICKECAAKINLPQGATDHMTISDLQQYLVFYDENATLRAQFQKEYVFDVDGWAEELEMDLTHGLFRLSTNSAGIVFPASCIRSFKISEDTRTIYDGSPAGLKCYESEAMERLDRLQPTIQQYITSRREYEHMRRMEELLDRDNDRPRRYIPEPRFDPVLPITKYHVVVNLNHPYWPLFQGELDGPRFGVFGDPDPAEYVASYEKKTANLEQLVNNLMNLIAPDAPVTQVVARSGAAAVSAYGAALAGAAASAAPAASVDVVAEIQKFKTLLDAGIITEEEFTAKKRQLLGI